MMGACGADDDVAVLLRQMFKKLRFQMIDHNQALGRSYWPGVADSQRPYRGDSCCDL